MGRRARRTAFLLFQLGLCSLVLEGTLRLAAPFHAGLRALLYSPTVRTEYAGIETTEELLRTSILGFRPGKRTQDFVLNSRGFRTPEYATAAAPGVLRVLVLGDSFAFASGGVPWSRMWPTRLGESLSQSLPRPVEVINLGVPGVGPRFELRLWELEGTRLRPDVVVLGFFIGNDFTDESGQPLEPTRDESLARWSYAYRAARNLHRVWRERRRAAAETEAAVEDGSARRTGFEAPGGDVPRRESARISEKTYLNMEFARLALTRRSRVDEFEELLDQVIPVLDHFINSVRRHGADPVVVMIPDEYQVNPSLLERLLERHRIARDDIDLDYPQRRLAAYLEAEGVAFLDLLPMMRERSPTEPLFWPQDTHWNLAGNRLAGELTAQLLAERLR